MNRKKSAAIVLCAMLAGAMVLAGCGNTENTPTSSVVSQAPPRVETPENAEINQNMTLTGYSLTKDKIVMNFPLVTDLDVPEKGNPVNTLIQQDVSAVAEHYAGGEGTFDYEVIYNNGKIISILYTGNVTVKGTPDPVYTAFTTNVSLETGKRISSGAPEKAAEIAALLVSGEGYTVEGEEEVQQGVITSLKAMDQKTLEERIAAADFALDASPDRQLASTYTAYAGEQKVIILLPFEHTLDGARIVIDWAPPAPEEPVTSNVTSQSESEVPGEKASSEPVADPPASAVESAVSSQA